MMEEKEDEIIDVGEAEKIPRPQRVRVPTEKERERRESTEKKLKKISNSQAAIPVQGTEKVVKNALILQNELTIQRAEKKIKKISNLQTELTIQRAEKKLKKISKLQTDLTIQRAEKKMKKISNLQSELTIEIPKSNTKMPKPAFSSGYKSPRIYEQKHEKQSKRPKCLDFKSATSPPIKCQKSPVVKTKRSPSLSSAKSPHLLSPKSPSLKVPKSPALKSPKSPKPKVPLPSPSQKSQKSNDKGAKNVTIVDNKKSAASQENKAEAKKVKYNRTISRHGWTLHGTTEKRKFMSQVNCLDNC